MTTSTKQRLLIAFSCVLVGCAVGATMPRLAAQSYPANPSAQRWEQFCEVVADSEDDGRDINAKLAERGAQGFEFVSTGPSHGARMWICFKHPVAR